MATTETITTSTEEQLRALVRLQYLDSRLDQLTKLRGDLPEEIRDLEDEKTGLETRIENAAREAKESDATRKRRTLDVAESEGLIQKYEEQQLQVRNNREYDALTKEIEAHRARIAAAGLETEELVGRDAGNEEAVVAARERLAELDGILAEKQQELDKVVGETKSEQNEFAKRRTAATETVEPRYLRAYEKLRERMRDGRAVVPLERGAAAGYSVPPQRQVEIRQRDRIVACEHTGRIIADEVLFRQAVEEIESELK